MSAGSWEVRAVHAGQTGCPAWTSGSLRGHCVDLARQYVDNPRMLRGPHARNGNIGWETWFVLYLLHLLTDSEIGTKQYHDGADVHVVAILRFSDFCMFYIQYLQAYCPVYIRRGVLRALHVYFLVCQRQTPDGSK
jgi:hypothetical protein